jgi:uncharacterized protein YbjT (DUF2867 family)
MNLLELPNATPLSFRNGGIVMKIAITGGTGFVGSHLTRELASKGHHVVLISRGGNHQHDDLFALSGVTHIATGLSDVKELENAFAGCDAVAHLAGINREIKAQTYRNVHITGTANVVAAAKRASVKRLCLLSFLRARSDCGSPYHETKWEAEEIVRNGGLPFTVVKAGVIYGRGDHMLSHISQTLKVMPLFGLLGSHTPDIMPIAISDLVRILVASLAHGSLDFKTVAAVGPERLSLKEAVQRVGKAIGVRPIFLPLPLVAHYCLAWICEAVMSEPIVSKAQVRILSESLAEPSPWAEKLVDNLAPVATFSVENIRAALIKKQL